MKVIVADDSKATRSIVKKMLKQIDRRIEVFEAEDGEKALEILYEQEKVDLILLDWNMPNMDGFEFLKAVKKDPRWKDIKVMMITSKTSEKDVEEALNAGADEYLMKPFDKDMLKAKLDMILGGESE